MFKNLRELITSMPTEKMCRDYVAKQRWNGKTVCPYCKHDKCYVIEGGKRYKCGSSKCYKRFTVTVGTIFEASNIQLSKWLTAIYLISAHKKGISSYQLARDLGVTQKTAWFMLHRIREMLRNKLSKPLDNIVEADEMYVGGSISNKHVSVRKKFAESEDSWQTNKTTVLGMIERNGEAMATVIQHEDKGEIEKTVRVNTAFAANIVTDSHQFYKSLNDEYYHYAVNHKLNEFVRLHLHTNSVEGMFSHFKRMIYGIYHQISPTHTQRYLDEFIFRYNSRKITDADRFAITFNNVERRLTYKALISSQPLHKREKHAPKEKARKKPVYKILDGEILERYASIGDAAKENNVARDRISICIRSGKTTGGFNWSFA